MAAAMIRLFLRVVVFATSLVVAATIAVATFVAGEVSRIYRDRPVMPERSRAALDAAAAGLVACLAASLFAVLVADEKWLAIQFAGLAFVAWFISIEVVARTAQVAVAPER